MATLVQNTLDRLIDLVIEKKAGAHLPPQEELSVLFGVSRTVLREAVSKLEYLGVVSSRPKIGTVINEPSAWKLVNADVIAWRTRAGETKSQVCESVAQLIGASI
jgi:DNA-binding FadR family transcriptional regulator